MTELWLEEATAPVRTVLAWRSRPDGDTFPYDEIVDEYQRVGKHFVSPELLEALHGARSALPIVPGSAEGIDRLERFLAVALDKRDERYDYTTYLALDVLPMPDPDDRWMGPERAEERRDRLVAQLVTDALDFELAAAGGRTTMLPRLRPTLRTTRKRCRLALQAIEPCLRRRDLAAAEAAGDDAIAAARDVGAKVAAVTTPAERWALRASMLPVDVIHDEWMFIRVLQSFETTFALLGVLLTAAAAELAAGQPAPAVRWLGASEAALREALPLWSLAATMRVEAFRTFRNFTEGASAIQSRGYKLVESLCRRPDQPRLDSIAYLSVPEVRERVLAGQVTLDDAFGAARASGRHAASELDEVGRAMSEFADTLLQWRRTHYRVAVRMLGERTGTGYTEGVPYLAAVRTIPVFTSTSTPAPAAGDGDER